MTIIRFGFCNIRNKSNNQSKAEADDTDRDLDYFGYHKGRIY